jgi:hypothetical protein
VGGRGGTVYLVTNTADSGAGSLRACIDASGPRICVFRTGGTIAVLSSLTVANPFITIAGQTAPGGGIQISGPSGAGAPGNPALLIRTHDVVVQYLRVRRGHNAGEICNGSPWSCGMSLEVLANQASDNPYNIMFDHVSVEWSNYDALGIVGHPNAGVEPNSITVSRSLIGEEFGGAGQTTAAAIGGYSGLGTAYLDLETDMDFHHNLFMGSSHRMPLMTVKSGRLVNNVVYAWTYYPMRSKGFRDFIGNYFKTRTGQTAPSHEIEAWTTNDGNDTSFAPSFYVTGNAGPSDPGGTNNWTMTGLAVNESGGEASSPLSTIYQRSSPIPTPAGYIPITPDPVSAISSASGLLLNTGRGAPYDGVGASRKLDCSGNWADAQDSVDSRIVNAVANGTTLYGSYDYSSLSASPQSQADLGGWPTLAAGTPCADSNNNGLPDIWESYWAGIYGLGSTLNPNGLNFGDGYTNLEHYINGMSPVASPPPPTGLQLYVATTGNDANAGTAAAPWRTIQKAMNSATPGSTVNIMAGTYNERLTLGVSGTAGNYITFQPNGFSVPAGGCGGYTGTPCGGDQVILDYTSLGTVTDGIPFLEINGKSYVRIQGLTFQNFTTRETNFLLNWGVRIEGAANYIEMKYSKFLHNKETGPWNGCCALAHFQIRGPASNVWAYGNEIGDVVTNYGEALTSSGSSNFTAEENWFHDTDALGLTNYQGASGSVFRHNKFEYISIRRDGTVWYNNAACALYVDGGNTSLIERNFIDHAGVGIEALSEPGQPATHDVTIRNNVVRNSNQHGIVMGTWYSNTDGSSVYNINAYNNTFYGNNNGVVIRPMQSATVNWENNIVANNANNYVNTLNWNPGNTDYNLYFGGNTGPGTHNVTSDPLFHNAATGDLSLKSGSPAINTGDPSTLASVAGAVDFAGNPRIIGGRIDIGAYEYTTGAPPPTTSPCDVNGDGLTNVADVQLEVNMALGIAPCTNLSGVCTVVSVQRVVNAALGGSCVSL